MRYCERADIEDRFGIGNVSKWADLDDDKDAGKITARVERAIEAAGLMVDDGLRGGPYGLPVVSPLSGLVPRTIQLLAAQLAGVWLYEARGTEDFDGENNTIQHRLHIARADAERRLADIKAGMYLIDAPMRGSNRPEAITIGSLDA